MLRINKFWYIIEITSGTHETGIQVDICRTGLASRQEAINYCHTNLAQDGDSGKDVNVLHTHVLIESLHYAKEN